MPTPIRRLDPLMESARFMEEAAARFPGFGDTLYRWIRPIYADMPDLKRRLVRATCLLHDVSWRAHPDYRAEMSFESVTRANLGGLTHQDRVFIGFSLMWRYKQGRPDATIEAMGSLLPEEDLLAAELLGRAIRLGAMISGGSRRILRQTRLVIDDDTLTLELGARARMQQGETVEKRLQALAEGLGRAAQIALVD